MTEFLVVREEGKKRALHSGKSIERDTLSNAEKRELSKAERERFKLEEAERRAERKKEREAEKCAARRLRHDKTIAFAGKISMAAGKIDFDLPAFLIAIFLGLIGLVFIYSASSYSGSVEFGDSFKYVKTQAIAIGVGFIVMLALAYIRIDFLIKIRFVILGLSLAILALVFIPVIGVESYGAKRWINLGFSTIQPSEFAKFGLVVFVAAQCSVTGADKFSSMLVPLLGGLSVCRLLMLEPNMSVTVCVFAVVFSMLFFAGAKIKHLLLIVVPAIAMGVILILIEPYRLSRLMAFLDPFSSPLGEGYQLIQSYYALGSGGLFGVGLFCSRQKYLFLPFAESDFIFSIIGEETGLFGCLFIMLLFIVLLCRGIKISLNAKNRFSAYMAAGIAVMIAVQTMINVAVVSGAIPPTGLPLPFISAGGSSVVAYYMATGLLLNVSRQKHEKFLSSIQ